MWLLNVTDLANIRLEFFIDGRTPRYAILSHTWLRDNSQELTFQDFANGLQTNCNVEKQGYQKVYACCEQAQLNGLGHCWIDTCCINKESSAELSEAINSMFQWYREASICYALLEDVSSEGADGNNDAHYESALRNSRWFTRGWTLQELLAPTILIFYTREWTVIGTKSYLAGHIEGITGINRASLTDIYSMHSASVAAKMSWAARRETTRVEDTAYCLLGIFDVDMSLLYGERFKAFERLQEEILKTTDDQSLLAWTPCDDWPRGILARSPTDFLGAANRVSLPSPYSTELMTMTPRGLRMRLPFVQKDGNLVGVLQCVE